MNLSAFSSALLRGFTLVELLICIAIFGFITTVVIANYPESQMRFKLAEINQNVSLAFREAQMRGSAIDSQNSAVGGYGIFASSAAPNTLVLFNDFIDLAVPAPYGIPIGDGNYQTDPDETNTILTIPQRFSIAKLCISTGGAYSCNESNDPPISNLTVTFIRPNPMPYIYINNNRSTSYSAACFELHSLRAPEKGHVRSIEIFNSGLIKNNTNPC